MSTFKMLTMAAFTILCVSASAQVTKKQTTKKPATEIVKYSCPMHPAVMSHQPGKCPKCGMDLTRIKKENMNGLKTYTCPMHAEVTSNKPGKCARCKMDLKEKKQDQDNHQH